MGEAASQFLSWLQAFWAAVQCCQLRSPLRIVPRSRVRVSGNDKEIAPYVSQVANDNKDNKT